MNLSDMKDLFNNTSYWGNYLYASYQELVDKLGEPNTVSGDYKTQKEWHIVISDEVVFTLYDWKEYDDDVTDGEKYKWHIGHSGGHFKEIENWLDEHGLEVIHEKNVFTVL